MSTAVCPDAAECLAMRIGGEDQPDRIFERCWRQFADDAGIGYKLVHRTLVDMRQSVPVKAQAMATVFEHAHGASAVVAQIVRLTETRGQKISSALAALLVISLLRRISVR